ncbi:MAG: hypothetical protein R2819_11035 [Allomuricauda sp.]
MVVMENIVEKSTYQVQELLIRMDRNNKIIQRLSQKLNSYTCEPNNPSCFEQRYNLKQSFKLFAGQQKRIMELMQQKKGMNKSLEEDIQLHLERFKALEKEIAAYLLSTSQHS